MLALDGISQCAADKNEIPALGAAAQDNRTLADKARHAHANGQLACAADISSDYRDFKLACRPHYAAGDPVEDDQGRIRPHT
jgi:hypothetical protein